MQNKISNLVTTSSVSNQLSVRVMSVHIFHVIINVITKRSSSYPVASSAMCSPLEWIMPTIKLLLAALFCSTYRVNNIVPYTRSRNSSMAITSVGSDALHSKPW